MQRIGINHDDAPGDDPQGEWELLRESWWQRGLYSQTVAFPAAGINDSWISFALALQLSERDP